MTIDVPVTADEQLLTVAVRDEPHRRPGADRPSRDFRVLGEISVYTTCASSRDADGQPYLQRVREISRWSDEAGCAGMLIYTDNALLDPWIVAHEVLAVTTRLAPLVAVQPLYKHPYAVAKAVATFAHLYGRRVDLNFVAGGFPFDLIALGDTLDHDRRYDRLGDYASLVVRLLTSSTPVTSDGDFYGVQRLLLSPRPPEQLLPVVMVSGSSPAGHRCAGTIGAVAVEYPQPLAGNEPLPPGIGRSNRGMRIGVLARETAGEAWDEAVARFPDDPSGREIQQAVLAVSDSQWHHQLSDPALPDRDLGDGVYWLGPYRTYKTFCPYLVGSHEDVARYLRAYIRTGHGTVILDEPRAEEDLRHAARAFQLALA